MYTSRFTDRRDGTFRRSAIKNTGANEPESPDTQPDPLVSEAGMLRISRAIENYLYIGFQTPVQFIMKKKILSAIVMVIWLVLVSVFMLLARRFDLEIFFVLWLIGILVIVELADTRFSLPLYLRYIKYMVAAGIVLFGGIVTLKVLEILAK
jgi:hypothetical protein